MPGKVQGIKSLLFWSVIGLEMELKPSLSISCSLASAEARPLLLPHMSTQPSLLKGLMSRPETRRLFYHSTVQLSSTNNCFTTRSRLKLQNRSP